MGSIDSGSAIWQLSSRTKTSNLRPLSTGRDAEQHVTPTTWQPRATNQNSKGKKGTTLYAEKGPQPYQIILYMRAGRLCDTEEPGDLGGVEQVQLEALPAGLQCLKLSPVCRIMANQTQMS
eukprot:scaffold33600_cov19-Prasinocladus_malaysianus.AAC.1